MKSRRKRRWIEKVREADDDDNILHSKIFRENT